MYFYGDKVLNFLPDIGHLDFLEKAAAEGDFVIVGLHTDNVSTGYIWYTLQDYQSSNLNMNTKYSHKHNMLNLI